MQTKTKTGSVTFIHDDEYKGEVEIIKGEVSVRLPMESIRAFVAESVRFEMTDKIQKMKPSEILRRIA